jgi:nitrate reductase assembly molybdenum cofactor insertion protein NarJ
MEIISAILLILTCLLGYTTYNMLSKLETYEDYIDSELKKNEKLLETLRKLDEKRMFEKDDEVGSVFELIKEAIIRFKQFKDAQEKTT